MKKLVIGLFFLGFASLGYSQVSDSGSKEVKLEGVTVYAINSDYLFEVQNNAMAKRVVDLQIEVATFDLKSASLYKGKGGPYVVNDYWVTFKRGDSKAVANFDGDGKIVHSFEQHNNITFPMSIRNQIYRGHPGWSIVENSYQVSYSPIKGAKKTYKAQLAKGALKKKVSIDSEGRILAMVE